MRLVIDLVNLRPGAGGFIRYVRTLLDAVQWLHSKSGDPDSVVLLLRPDGARLVEDLVAQYSGFIAAHLVYRSPVHVLNLLRRETVIRGYNDDFSVFLFAGNYGALTWWPARSVTVVHDLLYRYARNRTLVAAMRHCWLTVLVRRSVNRSSRVVAISETTRESVGEVFGERVLKKSVVASTAVGLPQGLARSTGEPQSLKLPFDGYFLTVLTAPRHKNATVLFQAMQSLPEAKLVVVGPWRPEQAMPNVLCLESVSDKELVDLYRMAAGFVFPSLFEGQGLPVIEAAAFGVPIICSDLRVLREVTGGKAFRYIAEPRDVESWVHAMGELLASTRDGRAVDQASACQEFVRSRYSVPRMALGYWRAIVESRE